MKIKLITGLWILLLLVGLVGCGSKEPPTSTTTSATESQTLTSETTQTVTSETTQTKSAPVTLGDVIEAAKSTKETPVPFGKWAALTISDGGWPKPAYARLTSVITDQTQVQALVDEYNNKEPNSKIPALEEHVKFLDYVVAEYEVYFPDGFTESDHITFSGLIFARENSTDKWIASDGSNYYWMGTVTSIDAPSKETGYLKNGDTVKCKVVYPMIKGYTNYTLHYKERTEDLSATIDTYFAVK